MLYRSCERGVLRIPAAGFGNPLAIEVGLHHRQEFFVAHAGQGADTDAASRYRRFNGAGHAVKGGFLPAAFFPFAIGEVADGVGHHLPDQLRSTRILAFGLELLLELGGVLQGEVVAQCPVGGRSVPTGERGCCGLALGVGGGVARAGDVDLPLDVGERLAAFTAVLVAPGKQAAGVAQGVAGKRGGEARVVGDLTRGGECAP